MTLKKAFSSLRHCIYKDDVRIISIVQALKDALQIDVLSIWKCF